MTVPNQENPIVPPTEAEFQGNQLDLFQAFLCNTEIERDRLSNTFDLWDSIPRYSVSRQQMTKIRKEKGFLGLLRISFQYRGQMLEARIQATRILDERTRTETDYYPSANEELVEDALRKIAAEQRSGFFNKKTYRSGVVFTLYALREELKRRGHTRSYQEIILSLNILAGSIIEIHSVDNKNWEGFTKSAYITGLSAVSRSKLSEDPEARWLVQFHPLVTQAIDVVTYRQFNYAQMMGHTTQLARWLHKQLSLKFTFASLTTPFEIRFSTIKRDSALLDGYKRTTDAVNVLDAVFEELKAGGLLTGVKKELVTGQRGKIEDVVYILSPSREFVAQVKAANKRQTKAVGALGEPLDMPGQKTKNR